MLGKSSLSALADDGGQSDGDGLRQKALALLNAQRAAAETRNAPGARTFSVSPQCVSVCLETSDLSVSRKWNSGLYSSRMYMSLRYLTTAVIPVYQGVEPNAGFAPCEQTHFICLKVQAQ